MAYYSNNNPRIVLGYYLKVVKEKEGCPRKNRAHHGTENRNSPASFAGEQASFSFMAKAPQTSELKHGGLS